MRTKSSKNYTKGLKQNTKLGLYYIFNTEMNKVKRKGVGFKVMVVQICEITYTEDGDVIENTYTMPTESLSSLRDMLEEEKGVTIDNYKIEVLSW